MKKFLLDLRMAVSKKDIMFVGLQFLLFGAYLFDFSPITFSFYAVQILHLVFVGIGMIIIILSMLQLNRNLSPFPTPAKNSVLITHGMFSYIRHPIYTGIIIVAFFLAVYFGSVYKLIISVLLVLLFYFKSRYEEQELTRKFPDYTNYQRNTGRFSPKI